ncbi:MAG: 16S rRNA (adenine(1518)-N(6)/adenine(1519)-N(6))-dimethyltransferase RsmA [Minicystis sp.]
MSIAEMLRGRGLAPKKRFGQNFLADAHAARTIAEAATTPAGGTVVEIGAGLGALTRPLLERAAKVTAIEFDRDLVPILREDRSAEITTGKLDLIEGDAADVDWAAKLDGGPRPHVIAGNLPYLITGKLVEKTVGLADAIDRAVFMVQAEVADRLAARPDTDAYGALSVFVQAAFDVKRILTVKGGAFYPRPEVDSAVVLLVPHRPRRAEETGAFRAAVKAAFGARRKTLRNAWKGLYGWSKEELDASAAEAGIDLGARGETLGVEAFAKIARLGEKRS